MATGLERKELRSYEIRKRKHKKRVLTIITISILTVLAAAAIFVYQLLHKNYTDYQVIHTTERIDSSTSKYLSYGTGTVRYSRDGAMAMDGSGNLLWNGSYEMKDPMIDICGKYVVVSDRGHETIQIYNGEGGVSTINVLNPILKVEVANQGVIAVLMDGVGENYITLYSLEGKALVDIGTTASENGFPVDMTLSDDGRKLVTSYVSINNGTMENKVTFYNFGEVGQNYSWRIVASFDYGESLVPNIEFIDNNTVCAFADNKFSIYVMEQVPKLTCEVTLPSEVTSIFYNENNVGFSLRNKEGDAPIRILVYNLNGKVQLDKNLTLEHANIKMSGDELIIHSGEEWKIWRLNGGVKFDYAFDGNVSYILPVNNLERYIVIDDKNINEVTLIEKQKE